MTLDILLPYWGDPELCRQTILSVLAQTNPEWRLTVVDDAYPDPEVGKWVATLKDSRVQYLRQAENVGITDNYRRCLTEARGEFCVFLGCDDLLLPNFVDVIVQVRRRAGDADIIQPGVQTIDETGRVMQPLVDRIKMTTSPRVNTTTVFRGEALATSLMRGNWLYWPSLVFRTERLRQTPFRDDFPLIQDLGLVIDLISSGSTLAYDPTICFQYRRHSASASSSTKVNGRRFPDEARYFSVAAEGFRGLGWRRAERAARWNITSRLHALASAPTALLQRDRSATAALLRHALKPSQT